MSSLDHSAPFALIAFVLCGCGAKVSLDGSGQGGDANGGITHQVSDCSLAKDPGPCEAAITAYAFNSALGLCEPFVYGGCQGNANRFATAQECYAVCAGHGGYDYAGCKSSADCRLLGQTCCLDCSSANLADWVAVNSASYLDWYQTTCGGTSNCSPCQVGNTNFWASCEAGHCVVSNLKDSPLYSCSQNSDCVLRNNLNCCEGCGSTDPPLSVNVIQASMILCQGGVTGCIECDRSHYGYAASCINSRCTTVHLTY
jgi:hypothetical protein